MVDQLHFMDIAWTRQGCFLVPKPSSAAIGAVFPDWQTLILSVFSSHFMSVHFQYNEVTFITTTITSTPPSYPLQQELHLS